MSDIVIQIPVWFAVFLVVTLFFLMVSGLLVWDNADARRFGSKKGGNT